MRGGGAVTCPGAHLGISRAQRTRQSCTQGVWPQCLVSLISFSAQGPPPTDLVFLVLMPVPLEGRTGCV